MNLKKKTVLVTGGTRGIGKAIADAFVEKGADVIITGTSPLEDYNGKYRYMQANFSLGASDLIHALGINNEDIDILVNNAGINIIEPLEDIDMGFNNVLKVNLEAPFELCRFVSRGMRKREWGRIVNIASIWSEVTKAGRTSYSTSKAGLVGMTRTLGIELCSDGVLVNSVSPGFTMTQLTKDSLSEEEMKKLSEQIPMNRFAQPEEIAKVVLFLASEDNTYITGQNIVVDGGFTSV